MWDEQWAQRGLDSSSAIKPAINIIEGVIDAMAADSTWARTNSVTLSWSASPCRKWIPSVHTSWDTIRRNSPTPESQKNAAWENAIPRRSISIGYATARFPRPASPMSSATSWESTCTPGVNPENGCSGNTRFHTSKCPMQKKRRGFFFTAHRVDPAYRRIIVTVYSSAFVCTSGACPAPPHAPYPALRATFPPVGARKRLPYHPFPLSDHAVPRPRGDTIVSPITTEGQWGILFLAPTGGKVAEGRIGGAGRRGASSICADNLTLCRQLPFIRFILTIRGSERLTLRSNKCSSGITFPVKTGSICLHPLLFPMERIAIINTFVKF